MPEAARPRRNTRARATALGLVLAACLGARTTPASAHQGTSTFGEVTRVYPALSAGGVQGGDGGRDDVALTWRLRIAAMDLMSALALASPGAFAATAPDGERLATEYLGARLHVAAGREACVPGATTLTRDPSPDELALVFERRFNCAGAPESIHLRYDVFFEIDPVHASFTRLALGAGASAGAAASATATGETFVFQRNRREVTVTLGRPTPVWKNALQYLRLGVEHILTGYDHLSFLAALLLAAGLARRSGPTETARAASLGQAARGTATIISAFTVAHSLTLISQVLHPGWVSTRWVEPAIAFSVAYVGIENLFARRPRHRWLLVFGFGLIHGLGFASVLREIGLPRRGLLLCLLSFNAGVELGQLAALAVALPLIVLGAHRAPTKFERWGLRAGSAVIAAFGIVWFIARVIGRGR